MALNTALFTGLSGLAVNQAQLSVVGNNIANANTVAFKASRVLLKPQFYVTESAGSPPSSEFGGANPSQRGLGAAVATVEKRFDPGSLETTGKSTDLAIDGEGFFIVQGKEQKFTRDGAFILNQNNELTTTSGDFVQGFGVDSDGNIIPGALKKIQIPIGTLTKSEATTTVELQGNLNSGGQIGTVGNVLMSQPLTDIVGGSVPGGQAPTGSTALIDLRAVDSVGAPTSTPLFTDGQTLTLAAKRGGRTLPSLSFTIDSASTVDDLNAFFNQALGIDTGLTTGLSTPGSTILGAVIGSDPTNTRRLRIEANIGVQNALSLSGTVIGTTLAFEEASPATGESAFTSFQVYDSLGVRLNVNMVTTLEAADANGTVWRYYAYSGDDTDAKSFDPTNPSAGIRLASGTVSFDTTGRVLTTTPLPVQIDRLNTGAGNPLTFSLDFSNMNALADSGAGSSTMLGEPDGKPIGTLRSFAIGNNGDITGTYDNGTTELLGQIALATFDNPSGLVDRGGNMYITGGNSGAPKITSPLQLSAGGIRSGTLELSNVDLSDEFVRMIIASTGFSASSRVISTSDRLLTELLNTSR